VLFQVTVQSPHSGFVLRGMTEENAEGSGHGENIPMSGL